MIQLITVRIPQYRDPVLFRHLLSTLPIALHTRITRFHFEIDQWRSLCGYCALQKELQTHGFDTLPPLTYSSFGRPYFPDYPQIQFSISHSGDWVLMALAPHLIGVDVEGLRAIDYSIMSRFFASAEAEWVASAESPCVKNERFFMVWSMKESYIKAIGKGIYQSLDTFAILPDETGGWHGYSEKSPLPYRFDLLPDLTGACGALCLPASAQLALTRADLTPQDL